MADCNVDGNRLPEVEISESQRLALEQFTMQTKQTVQQAIPLLQRHQWDAQIAVTRFFDNDDDDAEENPALPPGPALPIGLVPSSSTSTVRPAPGEIARSYAESLSQDLDSLLEKGIVRALIKVLSSFIKPNTYGQSSPYTSWRKKNSDKLWDDRVQKWKEFRTQLPQFLHSPLQYPDSIRLLKFDDVGHDDMVRCSLQEVRLSDKPHYTALSYVWEDYGPIMNKNDKKRQKKDELNPHKERTIICNGKALEVKASVFAAISKLRKDLNGRYIWIDSICINQDDEREQSAQVMKMTEIYSGAAYVFIWLGGRHPNRDFVLPHLERIPKYPKSAADTPIMFDGRQFSSPEELVMGSSHYFGFIWCSTIVFLLDGWFQRVWTLQEFVCAKDFGFYYDGYQIPTCYLESAVSWSQLLQPEAFMFPLFREEVWYRRAYPIFELRDQFQRGKLLDLSESVLISAARSSTKPQDHIFGILALTERSSLEIESIPGDILEPDYGKPFDEVFIDLTRRLLYGKIGLSVLSLVSNAEEAHPRWTEEIESGSSKHTFSLTNPDKSLNEDNRRWRIKMWPDLDGLRIDAFPSWVPKLLPVPGTQPYYLRGSNVFSTATSMKSSFSVSKSGRTLTVSAAKVDTVKFQVLVASGEDGIGMPTWPLNAIYDCTNFEKEQGKMKSKLTNTYFWSKVKPFFNAQLGPNSIYKHTGQRILSAFWRTLLSDLWYGTHPAPRNLESDFIRWLARQDPPSEVREYLGLDYTPESEPEKVMSFFGCALTAAARTRAFFVTEKGYYGLGPSTVRRGDSVMVLPGTQVPYLFRPHMVLENSWVLIGETYVHGIMHGEALQLGLDFHMVDIV